MSKKKKKLKYTPVGDELNESAIYWQAIHVLDVAATKALEDGNIPELLNVHDKLLSFAEMMNKKVAPAVPAQLGFIKTEGGNNGGIEE